MPRIVLVLRDLHPARLDTATQAALPRLPVLEGWLQQGEPGAAPSGWREWLWREFGGAAEPAAPPASIAAAAVAGVPAGEPLWLATPVHFVAGLDTVRLHPAGLLTLEPREQAALAEDFARVFAGSGHSLHATGRRELLLAGGARLAPAQLRSHDPARWLGMDPRDGFPAGEAAPALRRLGAEIEMWLHEHPVNRARAARGLLEANGLWLWGGGAPARGSGADGGARQAAGPPSGAPAATAWADDLYVDGLMRLQRIVPAAAAQRWPAAAGDALAVCALGARPDAAALLALERDWLGPAYARWRAGAVRSAILLVGDRTIRLQNRPWGRLMRAVRRRRPWWETLLQ